MVSDEQLAESPGGGLGTIAGGVPSSVKPPRMSELFLGGLQVRKTRKGDRRKLTKDQACDLGLGGNGDRKGRGASLEDHARLKNVDLTLWAAGTGRF